MVIEAMPDREFERRRRVRNIALGVALAALAALFFLITIVKLGGD